LSEEKKADEEIIGVCCYCKQPIKKGEKYHKALFFKDRYYHDMCARVYRARALAVGAYLRH